MSRVFIDGFENGGPADLWDAESNANVVSSAGKDMDGDYCLDINSGGEYIEKNITADDEMYAAVLWRPDDSDSRGIIHFYKDGTLLVTIRRNSTSSLLEACRETTLVDTGTNSVPASATYLIEVRVLIHDSTGRIQVKVDGISDIDFTGDTKPGADTQFNRVRLGYASSAYSYSNAYFDNLILDDAAWIGDTKIQKILPTGAGTTTGWTPSAGNNWACVDERPASDADHVSINANNIVDTYAAGNMAGSIGSVKCVQVQSRTESDGAPTPTNLKLAVRSGGTDYFSGDSAVPAAPKGLWNLWETNPNGSVAWTETTVNACEIGIKSAA